MANCCVRGCDSYFYKDLQTKFFSFPKVWKTPPSMHDLSKERYKRWVLAINRTGLRTSQAHVCSKHFVSGKPGSAKDFNDPDWVPSLNLGHTIKLDPPYQPPKHTGNPTRTSTKQMLNYYESEEEEENSEIEDMEANKQNIDDLERVDKIIEGFFDDNMDVTERTKQPSTKAINCCVPNCTNVRRKQKSNIKFFRFPKPSKKKNGQPYKHDRAAAWIKAIKRADITTLNAAHKIICSEHFQSGAPANDKSHSDWIPNQKMPKQLYIKSSAAVNETANGPSTPSGYMTDEDIQMEVDANEKIASLEKQLQLLNSENNALNQQIAAKDLIISSQNEEMRMQTETNKLVIKKKDEDIQKIKSILLKISLSREGFTGDDKKVNYFTGIPNLEVLDVIFDYVKADLISCMIKNMKKFDALILVLMKLRLDLPIAYLGYRFGISCNAAATVFHTNLKKLHDKIGSFIRWPDKEGHREDTCVYFKRVLGNKFTCLLDFIEDPGPAVSNELLTQRNYVKKKYLVAISPGGAIIYVSKIAFDCTLSVKEIAEKSGLLDLTDDGEIILSNHGKQTHQVATQNSLKVLIPLPNQQQKDLLESLVLDSSSPNNDESLPAENNRTNIHKSLLTLKSKYFVLTRKHNNGLIKSYKNKDGTSDTGDYFSYVVRVCCALSNVSPAVRTVGAKPS